MSDQMIHEQYQAYASLVAEAQTHLHRAKHIEIDDGDRFTRICVSGFLINARPEDWGKEPYAYISDARAGEFSDETLRENFEDHWQAIGLFHCLAVGLNLGLVVSGKISADEFNVCEVAVYPYRDANFQTIASAFRSP